MVHRCIIIIQYMDTLKQSSVSEEFWYVYVLRCINGMIYTGCTNNLEERIQRHNSGQILSTKGKLPVKILTYIAFTDKYKAYNFERYLKRGSGRAFANRHLR